MTRTLQAVYERGVLRPLEPLPLAEHQQVTVTVSDPEDPHGTDATFLRYLEAEADDSVTLESVRAALAKIPGSLAWPKTSAGNATSAAAARLGRLPPAPGVSPSGGGRSEAPSKGPAPVPVQYERRPGPCKSPS